MTFFKKHIKDDEIKYKALFYTYHHRVFMYIAKKVKGRENIMDITQNVFVHLWQYRKSLLESNPEAIIFNTCNQEISKFLNANQNMPVLFNENIECKDHAEELLELKIENEQRIESMYNNIGLLPPLRQKILRMNKLYGLTQAQIALELQIPQHTVKYHVSEAMIFLKNNTN